MPDNAQHPRRSGGASGAGQDALLLCVVVALCAAVVAGFAWTHATRKASVLHYTQSGRLSYSAPARPTSIYGRSGLTPGEPIYTHVVHVVHLSYTYRFVTTLPAKVSGTEQLVATMENGQGIMRTLPLSPVTDFTGESSVVSGTLNLAALHTMAHIFDKASGHAFSGNYTVGIAASINLHGTLEGMPVSATLDQPENFTYGSGSLVLNSAPGTATSTGGGVVQSPSQELSTNAPGSVSVPDAQGATLFADLLVSNARVGSLIVLVASLLLVWLLGHRVIKRAMSDDERDRIAARYGSSLVEVNELPAYPGVVMVTLNSFEGLRQVARRLECPILYRGDGQDIYAIVDNGTMYRYVAPAVKALSSANENQGDLPSSPVSVRTKVAADGHSVRS